MNNWKATRNGQTHHNYTQVRAADDDGLNFIQEGDDDDSTKKGVNMMQSQTRAPKSILRAKPNDHQRESTENKRCIHCGGSHGLEKCPDISNDQLAELLEQLGGSRCGQMIFQDDDMKGSSLNCNYLYLDTCSTEDQMVVVQYLDNVHTVQDMLTLHTNAGKSQTNKKGYLCGTAFWLDENGIANVISLRTLERKFHVMYDSQQKGGAFICHTQDGAVAFKRCPVTGFPYIDLSQDKTGAATMLVQTIRQNFKGYTREEVEQAILARKMQRRGGHPSEAVFRREANGSEDDQRQFNGICIDTGAT
ncbi:hypothetical protein ACHAW6_002810, partial [Cyclotella cf. meneghiniana]